MKYNKKNTQTLSDVEYAKFKLKSYKIEFEDRFNGSMLVVNSPIGNLEYYPSKRLMICKSTGFRAKGIESLIKYYKSLKKI
jgi:hypothetical protein